MIIAITHMREPSDIQLAEKCEDIDLILGGHDHFFNITHVEVQKEYWRKNAQVCTYSHTHAQKPHGTTVVKSGCDFRTLSYIDVYLKNKGNKNAPDKAHK